MRRLRDAMVMRTLGVEIEMAVACRGGGDSHCVGPFFRTLQAIKAARGETAVLERSGDADLAVRTPFAYTSVDNAYNNLEAAIGPVAEEEGGSGLYRLDRHIRAELADVSAALAGEGAAILNLSQHPAVEITDRLYHAIRAPKPIYDYWVGHRGWRHQVGIDAKAQNGPTTGVPVARAVAALNAVLAASVPFIGLFANSPFENGRATGLKETRLTIWPRMFAASRFPGDDRLHRLPDRPFRDLRHYLDWMFGAGTAMHAVPLSETRDYKGTKDMARVDGDPSLIDFLHRPHWTAVKLASRKRAVLAPDLRHMEFLQFSHFLDARIRYGFHGAAEVGEFIEARRRDGGIEELFGRICGDCYIEGRAPGANFPDADLVDEAGEEVAASVAISPSALQTGLIRNLEAAERWALRLDWRALGRLREVAVRDGLQGEVDGLSVARLCAEVLELAAAGLRPDERWMLAYPGHVLRTGRNGADRALALMERLPGNDGERLRRLIRRRMAVLVGGGPVGGGPVSARPEEPVVVAAPMVAGVPA